MAKLTVSYEVIHEVNIDVDDEIAKNLDFYAMWQEIEKVTNDRECLGGDILVVADRETGEVLYE